MGSHYIKATQRREYPIFPGGVNLVYNAAKSVGPALQLGVQATPNMCKNAKILEISHLINFEFAKNSHSMRLGP